MLCYHLDQFEWGTVKSGFAAMACLTLTLSREGTSLCEHFNVQMCCSLTDSLRCRYFEIILQVNTKQECPYQKDKNCHQLFPEGLMLSVEATTYPMLIKIKGTVPWQYSSFCLILPIITHPQLPWNLK